MNTTVAELWHTANGFPYPVGQEKAGRIQIKRFAEAFPEIDSERLTARYLSDSDG